MNMIEEKAIAQLDDAISDADLCPIVISVGHRLFEALCQVGRLNLGAGMFGYHHFVLDKTIIVYADLSVLDWGYRLHYTAEKANSCAR